MTRTALGRKERKVQKEAGNKETKLQNPEIEIIGSTQVSKSDPQPQNLRDADSMAKNQKRERNKNYYARNKSRILENIHQKRNERRLLKAEARVQKLKAVLEGGKAAESKAAESKAEESKRSIDASI